MRLLFVADGRSPITRGWVRHWVERGDEVFLASTFACDAALPVREVFHVPVAFSSTRATMTGPLGSSRHIGLRMKARHWLGPTTIPAARRRLRDVVARVRPDVVHAMRIPWEGILAAGACDGVPLVVSVWGNDFTLHGVSTPLMRVLTRRVLARTDALHADCHRDVRLARCWGLAPDKPTLVTPSGGGIRLEESGRPAPDAPVVINPRGFRDYVRNDVFFQSIPLVRARRPDVRVRCVAMAAQPQAREWVEALGLSDTVELLPHLSPGEMAAALRGAQVLVSPTVHDGTPNSLLEGMAAGCFPVAGISSRSGSGSRPASTEPWSTRHRPSNWRTRSWPRSATRICAAARPRRTVRSSPHGPTPASAWSRPPRCIGSCWGGRR